jgi:hypothetical protein
MVVLDGQAVIRIDPASGDRTIVSSPATGRGHYFLPLPALPSSPLAIW